MRIRFLVLAWILSLNFSTYAQDDETQILATVDKFFAALNEHDIDALREVTVDDTLHISTRRVEGATSFSIRNNEELVIAFSTSTGSAWLERYWDETVLIREDIAVFWAPYDFHIGGNFSHCGIDSFQLLKRDGVWLLSNMSWTMETENCPTSPLGPVN